MKNIIFLIALYMLSCGKNNSNPDKTFIDTGFELSLKDKNGFDLLDTNTQGHFEWASIKVFSLNGGEKVLLDDSSNPNLISKERGYYTLHLSTSSSILNSNATGESLILLQFSESIIDTIKTEWKAGKNFFYNTKMWYNGELKWERDKTESPILIIK